MLQVELVEPPAGVPVGEHVSFEGFSGEPEEVLNPKKRIFEQVRQEIQAMCHILTSLLPRARTCPWVHELHELIQSYCHTISLAGGEQHLTLHIRWCLGVRFTCLFSYCMYT